MTSAADRPGPRWVIFLLGVGVVSTTVTMPVLGWLWLELQFFGEVADQGDYLTASGVALVGLGWHVLALLTAWLSRAPAWLHLWSWGGAALMVLLFVIWYGRTSDPDLGSALPSASMVTGILVAIAVPWCYAIAAALAGSLATAGDQQVSGAAAGR